MSAYLLHSFPPSRSGRIDSLMIRLKTETKNTSLMLFEVNISTPCAQCKNVRGGLYVCLPSPARELALCVPTCQAARVSRRLMLGKTPYMQVDPEQLRTKLEAFLSSNDIPYSYSKSSKFGKRACLVLQRVVQDVAFIVVFVSSCATCTLILENMLCRRFVHVLV